VSRFLRLILAAAVCSLLGACAIQQALNHAPTSDPGSSPSTASIYYCLIASYFQSDNDVEAANLFYDKALSYDQNSYTLRRLHLLTALSIKPETPDSADSTYKLIAYFTKHYPLDEELLYATSDFYGQLSDSLALEQTVNTLQKDYPSARSNLQEFIFQLRYRQKADLSLLVSAEILGANDPQVLATLAGIYGHYDRTKQQDLLLQLMEVDPNENTKYSLAQYCAETQDMPFTRRFLQRLVFPADLTYLQYLADRAWENESDSLVVGLAPDILALRNIPLLNSLAISAAVSKRTDILVQISAILPSLTDSARDKQSLEAVLAAQSINANDASPLEPSLNALTESKYYDFIVATYSTLQPADTLQTLDIVHKGIWTEFSERIAKRLQYSAPLEYLQAAAQAAVDSTFTGMDDAKYNLIMFLRTRNTLSLDDYSYILGYLYRHKYQDQRRVIQEEALSRYPDDPSFNNDLGYTILCEGSDPDRAQKLIRKAVAIEPENAFYLDSLAWSYYLQGDYAKALELSEKPINMDNMPSEIAWHIGAIYYKLNDLENARLFLEKCITINDDPVFTAQAKELLDSLR
jgi:tetratricopeptide (TPR) repeat protein